MTAYKTLKGQSIRQVAQDPTNPVVGEIWYNTTIGLLKGRRFTAAAWANGGNLNTARFSMNQGAGTQTAGLGAGGNPSNSVLGNAEEYNGSSWSEQNDLNTARQMMGAAGTQTAGLFFGGRLIPPPSKQDAT